MDIVLVGGGHAHVEVLRSVAMAPIANVRLTVVSRDALTPYSGMIPGYIAGHYSHAEAHIDLRPLSSRAGARLIHAATTDLDLDARRVIVEGRPPVPFDIASLDIGSRPVTGPIAGADIHGLPVKPADRFLDRWMDVEAEAVERNGRYRLTMVGGGAAGVEVCLALQRRLAAAIAKGGGDPGSLAFRLVTDGVSLLPDHGPGVRRRLERTLLEVGIDIRRGARVEALDEGCLLFADGSRLSSDATILATGAAAATWLRGTGLALDDAGFVAVDHCLRSVSHPFVLAAGDIASFTPQELPKKRCPCGPPGTGACAQSQAPGRRAGTGLLPSPEAYHGDHFDREPVCGCLPVACGVLRSLGVALEGPYRPAVDAALPGASLHGRGCLHALRRLWFQGARACP